MRVISRRVLVEYTARYPNATSSLDAWYRISKAATWKNLAELRRTYPSSDVVGGLTVFNIQGNAHRLIARIFFPAQIIYVRAILTHAEYDKGTSKLL